MGLLSKLFGGNKKLENAARDIFNGLLKPETSNGAANSESAPANEPASAVRSDPSGDSWGYEMPAEPNQYNYPGTFIRYFESVFDSVLPEYQRSVSTIGNGRRYVYAFTLGGAEKLVVELMTEKSCAAKIRNECRAKNVPYLRFYYDHDGWWNTQSYVVRRIRGAIIG